jgi:hypothetical protein
MKSEELNFTFCIHKKTHGKSPATMDDVNMEQDGVKPSSTTARGVKQSTTTAEGVKQSTTTAEGVKPSTTTAEGVKPSTTTAGFCPPPGIVHESLMKDKYILNFLDSRLPATII